MMFYKENRNPGFFNGVLRDGKGYSSSSIEVYVPIEETKTEGLMVLDGSLGYIGRADEPTDDIKCQVNGNGSHGNDPERDIQDRDIDRKNIPCPAQQRANRKQ